MARLTISRRAGATFPQRLEDLGVGTGTFCNAVDICLNSGIDVTVDSDTGVGILVSTSAGVGSGSGNGVHGAKTAGASVVVSTDVDTGASSGTGVSTSPSCVTGSCSVGPGTGSGGGTRSETAVGTTAGVNAHTGRGAGRYGCVGNCVGTGVVFGTGSSNNIGTDASVGSTIGCTSDGTCFSTGAGISAGSDSLVGTSFGKAGGADVDAKVGTNSGADVGVGGASAILNTGVCLAACIGSSTDFGINCGGDARFGVGGSVGTAVGIGLDLSTDHRVGASFGTSVGTNVGTCVGTGEGISGGGFAGICAESRVLNADFLKVSGTYVPQSTDELINTPEKVQNVTAKDGCINELFARLEEVLSQRVVTKKGQCLSRQKVLDAAAQFIKALRKKSEKMRRDVSRKKLIASRKVEKLKKQAKKSSSESIPTTPELVMSNKNSLRKKTVKRSSNHRLTERVPKTTRISEDKKKSDFELRSLQSGKVPITFVNEEDSLKVSKYPEKSIALFFADKDKTVECQEKITGVSLALKVAKVGAKSKKTNLKKGEMEKLEKKAFLTFTKLRSPRVKKEMPGCSRMEITDLLKCRWEGFCKKTKRRYRKIWEEQCQIRRSTSREKAKTGSSEKNSKLSKNVNSKSRPSNSSPTRLSQSKKIKTKLPTMSDEENKKMLVKKVQARTTEDKEVVSVLNWVQCDRCKNWRILHEDVNTDKLPKRWYCKMNKDKRHNRCSIPQEGYTPHGTMYNG